MDALAPFILPHEPKVDPEPLPYLKENDSYQYDINLFVAIKGQEMSKAEVRFLPFFNRACLYFFQVPSTLYFLLNLYCHMSRFHRI